MSNLEKDVEPEKVVEAEKGAIEDLDM